MPNRTAKFVSAIFASFLAGAPLTTLSNGAARAAGDCLSGPKDQTPQGGHWYYRIDHATKRHCWYLGEGKERLARVAPQDSPPLANPVSPPKTAATPRSVADAYAELPLAQTRVAQETDLAPGQRSGLENGQRPNAQDAYTKPSVVASRWPEQSDARSSAGREPATDNSGPDVQTNSEAAQPPAIAAVTFAAADSSSGRQSGSVQMLLIVIIGALSFAGLMGSAVFRFGNRRWTGRRQIRGERRTIWDSASPDRPSPPAYASADLRMPREPRAAGDPNDRIAEMLARLARSAAT